MALLKDVLNQVMDNTNNWAYANQKPTIPGLPTTPTPVVAPPVYTPPPVTYTPPTPTYTPPPTYMPPPTNPVIPTPPVVPATNTNWQNVAQQLVDNTSWGVNNPPVIPGVQTTPTPVTPTPYTPPVAPTATPINWQNVAQQLVDDTSWGLNKPPVIPGVQTTPSQQPTNTGVGTVTAPTITWQDVVQQVIDDPSWGINNPPEIPGVQTTPTGGYQQPPVTDTPPTTQTTTPDTQNVIPDTQTTIPDTSTTTPPQTNNNLPTFTPPTTPDYNSPYKADIDQALKDWNSWKDSVYNSPYASQIQALVNNVLVRNFQYDPSKDQQFQLASKELTRNVLEQMNARGILNSTVTENQVQQGISNMMPQYQQSAYERFQNEGNTLMKQVDMLMGLDETGYNQYMDKGKKYADTLDFLNQMDDDSFNRWKDARDYNYGAALDAYKSQVNAIEMKQKQVEEAWDRVNELGYVDNNASIILGVKVGTQSKSVRETAQNLKDDLEKMKLQQQYDLEQQTKNYNNQVKLEELRQTNDVAMENLRSKNDLTNSQTLENLRSKNDLTNSQTLENLRSKNDQSLENLRSTNDQSLETLRSKNDQKLQDSKQSGATDGNGKPLLTANQYITGLNKQYTRYDRDSGGYVIDDKEGLRKAILELYLDDATTEALLRYYGLPTDTLAETISQDKNYGSGTSLTKYGGGR